MSSFRDRLHKLRVTEEKLARVRNRLSDEQLGLQDGSEASDTVRERLAERIEDRMDDFRVEVPNFTVRRGFYEGKYSINMSLENHEGQAMGAVKEYSRVTFLLSPSREDKSMTQICKVTVRNRDLQSMRVDGNVEAEDDLKSLDAFVDEQMMRFAQAYFSRQLETVGSPASF